MIRPGTIAIAFEGANMKIILTSDVEKLGKAGDTMEVKDGFARNFLIPKKFAISATSKNLEQLAHQRKLIQARENVRKQNAQALKSQIEQLSVTIACKVGESDRLFGSVTTMDIAQALKKEKLTIDKRAIKLAEPLKALGVYTIPIHLEHDLEANLKIWLVKE